MDGWQPIEEHPLDEEECVLGIFDRKGYLELADRGGWVPGEKREEWDEVEEGICVKLWEDEEEGHWWSNHEIIDDPTHFMLIPTTSK